MYLSEQEQKFIRYLADCFENGRLNINNTLVCKELDLPAKECNTLIRAMEALETIDNVTRYRNTPEVRFRPCFAAVELARQVDANAEAERQPDFVEQIKNRIRRNPIAAWVIIGFIFLAFVSPIYSMVANVLERLGWIAVPK